MRPLEKFCGYGKTLLRLLLRVSPSMPEREAQGKYVPCENETVQSTEPLQKNADGKSKRKAFKENKRVRLLSSVLQLLKSEILASCL